MLLIDIRLLHWCVMSGRCTAAAERLMQYQLDCHVLSIVGRLDIVLDMLTQLTGCEQWAVYRDKRLCVRCGTHATVWQRYLRLSPGSLVTLDTMLSSAAEFEHLRVWFGSILEVYIKSAWTF